MFRRKFFSDLLLAQCILILITIGYFVYGYENKVYLLSYVWAFGMTALCYVVTMTLLNDKRSILGICNLKNKPVFEKSYLQFVLVCLPGLLFMGTGAFVIKCMAVFIIVCSYYMVSFIMLYMSARENMCIAAVVVYFVVELILLI